MTLADLPPYAQLTTDGQQGVFNVPFAFFEPQDLEVYLGPRRLILLSDYLVEGSIRVGQGRIRLTHAPPAGSVLTILRWTPLLQQASFRRNLPFPMATHEWSLDRVAASAQELREALKRAWLPPENQPPSNLDTLAGVRICLLEEFLGEGRYKLVPALWDAGEGQWQGVEGESLEGEPFNPCPHLALGRLVTAYPLQDQDGQRVWRFTLDGACPPWESGPGNGGPGGPGGPGTPGWECPHCHECQGCLYSEKSTASFTKPPMDGGGHWLRSQAAAAYMALDTSAIPFDGASDFLARWSTHSEPFLDQDGLEWRVRIEVVKRCSGVDQGWHVYVDLMLRYPGSELWEYGEPLGIAFSPDGSNCDSPLVNPEFWLGNSGASPFSLELANDTGYCCNCGDCYFEGEYVVVGFTAIRISDEFEQPDCSDAEPRWISEETQVGLPEPVTIPDGPNSSMAGWIVPIRTVTTDLKTGNINEYTTGQPFSYWCENGWWDPLLGYSYRDQPGIQINETCTSISYTRRICDLALVDSFYEEASWSIARVV